MQESLWRSDQLTGLKDCHISIYRSHFSQIEANHFLSLLQKIHWDQNELIVFGEKHLEPRETAWYGNPGVKYGYSGIEHESKYWLPFLEEIRDRIKEVTESSFNSVLLNRYRDEKDSVAWHADDEPELGESPFIASLSLGSSRPFQVKPKNGDERAISIELMHGDLLTMSAETQSKCLHQIPKTSKTITERINLTFRNVTKTDRNNRNKID